MREIIVYGKLTEMVNGESRDELIPIRVYASCSVPHMRTYSGSQTHEEYLESLTDQELIEMIAELSLRGKK